MRAADDAVRGVHQTADGSTAIKVEPPLDFRQRFYRDLKPWEHCVPIKPDLSDMSESIAFVFADPDEAEAIGRRWRTRALPQPLSAAAARLCRAIEAYHARGGGPEQAA